MLRSTSQIFIGASLTSPEPCLNYSKFPNELFSVLHFHSDKSPKINCKIISHYLHSPAYYFGVLIRIIFLLNPGDFSAVFSADILATFSSTADSPCVPTTFSSPTGVVSVSTGKFLVFKTLTLDFGFLHTSVLIWSPYKTLLGGFSYM